MAEHEPNSQEQAALELYHQLVNLSPDNGDFAVRMTLRLPNGRLVGGDILLSATDVEQLIDGALTIAQHRIAYGDPEEAAGPLPVDEGEPLLDVDEDDVKELIRETESFLNGGSL